MAEYCENVLSVIRLLAAGGWPTVVGYGYWLPPIKDPGEADAWMARHGRKRKMLGPLMLLIALVYTALKIFAPLGP
jgi:hypothetical protein